MMKATKLHWRRDKTQITDKTYHDMYGKEMVNTEEMSNYSSNYSINSFLMPCKPTEIPIELLKI